MPPEPAAAVPQRLCPHCASVATTAGRECPWCGRSYRRRTVAAVAALLAVQTLLVAAVLIAALAATGSAVRTEVEDETAVIRRDIDRQVEDISTDVRRQLREELDRRLPAPVP